MSSPIGIRKSFPLQKDQQRQIADQKQKFKKASEMYEQHFLRQMVKAMRKTVGTSGFIKKSYAENIYREQLDNEYVELWSKTGGIGLSDMIYQQLAEKFLPSSGPMQLRPKGPLPTKGTEPIEIRKPKQFDLDSADGTKKRDMSFLLTPTGSERDVLSPWEGIVEQNFSGSDGRRQTLKISHNNGLSSLLSFLGNTQPLNVGDRVAAGQKLGGLDFEQPHLAWKVTENVTPT